MARIKSQLWTNEKGKRFVVLPEQEFLRLSEMAEDRGLSQILEAAIQSDTDQASVPFGAVKRQLGAHRRATAKKKRSDTKRPS